ncbi:hypothetical protein V5O48_016054 [Marasmius crinis-equi]|uniref:HAT C-terminal dimerisation domain-containing protein n=1 Tax=Marasmius crinis-equi TaxID=585013 RepID=A0ABR3ESV1_9AGAR
MGIRDVGRRPWDASKVSNTPRERLGEMDRVFFAKVKVPPHTDGPITLKSWDDKVDIWRCDENIIALKYRPHQTLLAATSCDAERGFSQGGLMVTKRRYALSSSAIRASLCLSYWAKVPGLIPEEAIVNMFNDKGKRRDDRVTVKSLIEKAGADAIEVDGSSASESE